MGKDASTRRASGVEGVWNDPSASAATPGTMPTTTATLARMPSGCFHPNDASRTSRSNAARAAAAAIAVPSATGTSSTPACGAANGSSPRSPSTARAPKTTTSRPARTAQVRRQARAISSAAMTGRYSANESAAKSVRPISNDANGTSPRPGSPIGDAPTRSSHDQVTSHGRFKAAATAVAARPVTKNHIAVVDDALASRVPSASTAPRATASGRLTGANAAAIARTMPSTTIRRTRSSTERSTNPSATSRSAARGSAVASPAARPDRCTNQGTNAYTTRTVRRPDDIDPLTSGVAAYTSSAATCALVDGNTVASFHAPAAPTTTSPRTNRVCNMPMWNNVSTERPDSVAQPVGFAEVAPAPSGFHPDMYVSSNSRGLEGNGRNSPTGGIPPSKNERAPMTTPTMTAIQARTGAVVL